MPHVPTRQAVGNRTEFSGGRGRFTFQLVDDCCKKSLRLSGELAVARESHKLSQQTDTRHHDEFFAVDTDRETQPALVEKLKDLHDVFAAVG